MFLPCAVGWRSSDAHPHGPLEGRRARSRSYTYLSDRGARCDISDQDTIEFQENDPATEAKGGPRAALLLNGI